MLEVTSSNRPDTAWRHTDAHGHVHGWYEHDQLATRYTPTATYDLPSLLWVKDGEQWHEDADEPMPFGHFECRLCAERIEPRYKADETR